MLIKNGFFTSKPTAHTYMSIRIGIMIRRRLTISPAAVARGLVNVETFKLSLVFRKIRVIVSRELERI